MVLTPFQSALCLLILSLATGGEAVSSPLPQDPAPDQQPITTIKVATRMVAISAVVKSRTGEPRGGLSREDFVLRQDGKEEPIHYFSQGADLPLTLALLVDTSGSQRTFLGDESLASDVFFQTMLGRKQDRAMLVQFDTKVVQLRGLTSSSDALHLALLSLSSRASAVAGTLLNDAVYAVSKDVLAKEPGRKAIVILSDGGDNGSRRSLEEAVEQAQRGDVQIYSILYSAWAGFSGTGMGRASGVDAGRAILQKLSETTGGRVFTVSPTQGLREIFAQIAQDLRLQYELGYTPPPGIQPNTYHRLELKARDKSLTVQARKGFFAQP
ncbi:MAG: hypothetical protein NVSMB3_05290 [Acidobacteriaceae bacterium]